MGFRVNWCKWIRTCISMVQFSVLINESLADFFCSSSSLRQGDLLSPMLFLIMMEVFSRMLRKVEGVGLICGFKAKVGGVVENVFQICCLQMILFYFVMQLWSKFFIFGCCYFVFRL